MKTSLRRATSALFLAALVNACAQVEPGAPQAGTGGAECPAPAAGNEAAACGRDPLLDYVAYMSQAVEAGAQGRDAMKLDAERRMRSSPLTARVQIGFLLTSPGESLPRIQEGTTMLEDVLASETGLDAGVRQLIEMRLAEVEARRSLRVELEDIKGKIEELMSIESSMEEERSKSEQRPR